MLYAQFNLGDLNEAFESESDEEISVNGDFGDAIVESEVEKLLFTLA